MSFKMDEAFLTYWCHTWYLLHVFYNVADSIGFEVVYTGDNDAAFFKYINFDSIGNHAAINDYDYIVLCVINSTLMVAAFNRCNLFSKRVVMPLVLFSTLMKSPIFLWGNDAEI